MNCWKTRLFKSRLALLYWHLISWNGGRKFVRPILLRYKATIPVYSRCWIAAIVALKKGWEATMKFHRNYHEVMCLSLTFVRPMKKLQRCSVFNLRQARSELRLKKFFASGNIMKLSWILKSIEFFSALKNEKSKLWLLLSNMLSLIHSFPHSLFSFMWFIFFEFKDVSVDAL